MVYKYDSVHDWLEQYIDREATENPVQLIDNLAAIVLKLDADTIQDYFQSDMEEGGYFDEVKYFTVKFEFDSFSREHVFYLVRQSIEELEGYGCTLLESSGLKLKDNHNNVYCVTFKIETSLSIEELEDIEAVVEVKAL